MSPIRTPQLPETCDTAFIKEHYPFHETPATNKAHNI